MKERTLHHAPRVVALIAALAPAAVAVLNSLPWEWAVSLSAVALAAGEAAQKVQRVRAFRSLTKL